MTIDEANQLLGAIRECQGCFRQFKVLPPVKSSFMLAKNAAILAPELKAAQEAVCADFDMRMLGERDRKRRELAFERAAKDDAGKPISINGEWQVSIADAEEIVAKLTGEFPEADAMIAEQTKRAAEIGAQLCDVKLVKYPEAEWPDVPADILDRLMPLVDNTPAK